MASVSLEANGTSSLVTRRDVTRLPDAVAVAQLRRHVVRPQSQRVTTTDGFAPNRPGVPFPVSFEAIGALDPYYLAPASREKTVVICGASKDVPSMERAKAIAGRFAYDVVAAGGNVVTGCGSFGVMGAAFYGAADASKLAGAGENLTITKDKAWGDEDFVHGRAISREASEEARFDQFQRVAAHVVIMPGAVGTLLEMAKMIEGLVVPRRGIPAFETITVVNIDGYWDGLRMLLDTFVKAGVMKPEYMSRITFVDGAADLTAQALPACLRKP